jgi:hypothetical protein
MGFFGGMFIYMLRVNFSVAIVCMTYEPESNLTITNNTSTLQVNSDQHSNGVFNSLNSIDSYTDTKVCPSDVENEEQVPEHLD